MGSPQVQGMLCSGSSRKTKATDIPHLHFPALPPHAHSSAPRMQPCKGRLPDCIKLWSCGRGPRSKLRQLLMLGKLLNFSELQFPVRNTLQPYRVAGVGGMKCCTLKKLSRTGWRRADDSNIFAGPT